jgi:hypothetical protein
MKKEFQARKQPSLMNLLANHPNRVREKAEGKPITGELRSS